MCGLTTGRSVLQRPNYVTAAGTRLSVGLIGRYSCGPIAARFSAASQPQYSVSSSSFQTDLVPMPFACRPRHSIAFHEAQTEPVFAEGSQFTVVGSGHSHTDSNSATVLSPIHNNENILRYRCRYYTLKQRMITDTDHCSAERGVGHCPLNTIF